MQYCALNGVSIVNSLVCIALPFLVLLFYIYFLKKCPDSPQSALFGAAVTGEIFPPVGSMKFTLSSLVSSAIYWDDSFHSLGSRCFSLVLKLFTSASAMISIIGYCHRRFILTFCQRFALCKNNRRRRFLPVLPHLTFQRRFKRLSSSSLANTWTFCYIFKTRGFWLHPV